jgi:hypothetical protein
VKADHKDDKQGKQAWWQEPIKLQAEEHKKSSQKKQF